MLPTLLPGDRLLVGRLSLLPWRPRRGDIVLAHRQRPIGVMVKRVVGLPGEQVRIEEGLLIVNDRPLLEPYLSSPVTPFPMQGEWTLCPNEYFLLGDNRARSDDSRRFGPVHREAILGRAWYRYAPAPRRGALNGPAPATSG